MSKKNYSNRYIFIYISVLVILLASILSIITLGLKEKIEANKQTEKCQQILSAAGYQVDKSTAITLFSQVAQPIKDSKNRERYTIQCADGESGQVIAVHVKGLWGPIWGYVILDSTLCTIKGVVFGHKSETPGLGDQITKESFTQQFIGKKIIDTTGHFVSVRVLSPNKPTPIHECNRVDAISGATLTSRGVDQMLQSNLENL